LLTFVEQDDMEFLEGAIKFMLMMGAICVAIALLAALFMIVFNIATGVDDHLQD
jgi:hypothetical protein